MKFYKMTWQSFNVNNSLPLKISNFTWIDYNKFFLEIIFWPSFWIRTFKREKFHYIHEVTFNVHRQHEGETRKIKMVKEMIEMAKKWAKISYTFLLVYICQVSFACDTSARKRCNLFLSPTIETLNEVVTFYEASSYGRWRNFYPGLKFFSR